MAYETVINDGNGRVRMTENMSKTSAYFCGLETSIALAVIKYADHLEFAPCRINLLLIFSTWSARYAKSAAILVNPVIDVESGRLGDAVNSIIGNNHFSISFIIYFVKRRFCLFC